MGHTTSWYTLTTEGDKIVGVCDWDYEEYSMFSSERDDRGREDVSYSGIAEMIREALVDGDGTVSVVLDGRKIYSSYPDSQLLDEYMSYAVGEDTFPCPCGGGSYTVSWSLH